MVKNMEISGVTAADIIMMIKTMDIITMVSTKGSIMHIVTNTIIMDIDTTTFNMLIVFLTLINSLKVFKSDFRLLAIAFK